MIWKSKQVIRINVLYNMYHALTSNTAQKIKFSIKDSSVDVIKSAVFYGFGHIY